LNKNTVLCGKGLTFFLAIEIKIKISAFLNLFARIRVCYSTGESVILVLKILSRDITITIEKKTGLTLPFV